MLVVLDVDQGLELTDDESESRNESDYIHRKQLQFYLAERCWLAMPYRRIDGMQEVFMI